MKKLIITFLLITIVLCISYADVMPEGHHGVSRTVIISNCSSYPNYTLVGYITGPMIAEYELTVIEQDIPITKGYKFNEIKLFAIQQEVIQSLGGVENIDYNNLVQVTAPVAIIDPAGITVEDANPLISETFIYTIRGVENGALVLYLSEYRQGFDDGTPDNIEYFDYTR